MLGYDWPRFHAAVNDLPAALLFVTVLFDLGAWLTKRESLKAAALWTLWAGAIGGGVPGKSRAPPPKASQHRQADHQPDGAHPKRPPPPPGALPRVPAWGPLSRARPPPPP